MTVTVHLFARARDLAGPTLSVAVPDGATLAELRRALAERVPALGPLLGRSAFAVGQDFADEDRALRPGEEVALIPPVSGG